MKNYKYTKKQIKEAIAHWTAVLESSIDSERSSSSSEAAPWKVAWKVLGALRVGALSAPVGETPTVRREDERRDFEGAGEDRERDPPFL